MFKTFPIIRYDDCSVLIIVIFAIFCKLRPRGARRGGRLLPVPAGHIQPLPNLSLFITGIAIAAADARAEQTFDRFDSAIIGNKHQTNTKKLKTG